MQNDVLLLPDAMTEAEILSNRKLAGLNFGVKWPELRAKDDWAWNHHLVGKSRRPGTGIFGCLRGPDRLESGECVNGRS